MIVQLVEREEVGERIGEKRMSFLDHLSELANRLRRVLIMYFILVALFLILPSKVEAKSLQGLLSGDLSKFVPLTSAVLYKLQKDLLPEGVKLIPYGFTNPVFVYVEIAALMAGIITLPYFYYEMYMFVAPGLYKHEKRFLNYFIVSISVLLTAGLIYGYCVIIPLTLRILLYFNRLAGVTELLYGVSDFYRFVILTLAFTSLFFTFPVFLVLATKFGVVDIGWLKKNKRYVYATVFILSAMITPDTTGVTMLLVSIPFIALYELSLAISKLLVKKSKQF